MEKTLTIHVLLVVVLLLNLGGTFGDTKTERQALLHFKSTISNTPNSLSEWNSTSNSTHCNWFGVFCRNKRVHSLRLPELGLTGTISPHLSNLTSLRILDLFNNSFTGPISLDFSQLTLLQRIILATNSMNGPIPTALSNCFNLKEISFQFNNLSGTLPQSLARLSRLQILDLSVNRLAGPIPTSFGNLSSLTSFSIARNNLYGNIPNELGHLSRLVTLQVSENQLTGKIPSSIFNISSLVYLSLSDNNLYGELPAFIGVNIEKLFVPNNELEGLIPASLSNCSKIQMLDLSSNKFQGVIPLLGIMKDLVELHLGKNNLSSTTELNSQVFHSLSNCTRLQMLMMNSNHLTGEMPVSVSNLSTHLQEFCVDDNFLTGNFPRGFEKFRNLTALSLHGNLFNGEMPSSLGELQQLRRFMLHQNAFSGKIPDVFGNLTRLYFLTMGHNQFSGGIPASIGKCQRLVTLGLAGNRLDGNIPIEIFGLSGLSNLQFSQNFLSGNISSEVGGLTQIEVMDISNNLFSGQIPRDIENLQSLQKLNLSFNDFEGQVPARGVFMNLSSVSLQGNEKLCGATHEVSQQLTIPICSTESNKSNGNGNLLPKIMIPIASFIVLVFAIYFMPAFIFHKKKKIKRWSLSFKSPPVKGLPQTISYSEISKATNDFATTNLIGKGGFGSVYRGTFGPGDDGSFTTLAVKVIDFKISKASESFKAECEALRNVRHRNLVKVSTSCSSIDNKGAEFKALIMEFMSNGSLDQWLYSADPECGTTLNFTTRLHIAIDVASAIDYLHHDYDPPVVHCDLKPGNVLLDDNMVAHVGDFGLARFLSPNTTHNESSTIGLKGSIGYIPPEYGLGSKASTEGDVYSFGVLLLEMFTARKPTQEMFQEVLNLNKFVDSAVQAYQVLDIVDPALLKYESSTSCSSRSSIEIENWSDKTKDSLVKVIRVGLSCVAQRPKHRLTMRETLSKLQEIKAFLQN